MNLPASFTEYTRALLGVEEYEKLVSALQQEPPVSIRLNRLKVHRLKVENALSVQPPWSSEGIYLDERLTFTFDPLFHAGCYYVQEASSMFVEQVLRQHVTKPVVMLDLCAAPGGFAGCQRGNPEPVADFGGEPDEMGTSGCGGYE